MELVLIGLGRMGLAYVERLNGQGHRVHGYDVSPEAMQALLSVGGNPIPSLRSIRDLRAPVLLSLPDASIVDHVVADILRDVGGPSFPGIIDLSTSGPLGAQKVAATVTNSGLGYAEAPVTGGVAGARGGTLTLMASGDPTLLDAVDPILRCLGTVVRLGDRPGLGQTMKVLNNLLSATNLAITSEVLAAGAASGLDPTQMIEVFNAGSGKNAATLDKFPKYVLSGTFDQGFAASLMAKDVRLAQELLHAVAVPAWVSAAVMETWLAASRQLPQHADFTEIARLHASYVSNSAWTSSSIYEE
jgi:3-hydroxyisobutyrate dehydrogenase-like beta-hydroxyacid dehydrogenase